MECQRLHNESDKVLIKENSTFMVLEIKVASFCDWIYEIKILYNNEVLIYHNEESWLKCYYSKDIELIC